MTSATVIVPPLVKYTAGPLLGPAMLVGAAHAAGHRARTLDLNNEYLRERLPAGPWQTSGLTGDHDKPVDLLRQVEERFRDSLRALLPSLTASRRVGDLISHVVADHEAVENALAALVSRREGQWIEARLAETERPDLVGLSILYGGQVIWGLAISVIARRLWPGVPVVWGGPHVTALKTVLATDSRMGRHVDGFVLGYAERTFVELLDAISRGHAWPVAVVRPGTGHAPLAEGNPGQVPAFDNLSRYGVPRLTLPAQTSRGCAYGRCQFCTYPAIEGVYRPYELALLEPVVELAERVGAGVSFKDSLVLPERLAAIAANVRGRVRWSACTKLDRRLDAALLRALAASGCDTLEVGLETLDPTTQATIHKRQREDLFRFVVEGVEDAGISLVVNYITGFPGEDEAAAASAISRIRAALAGKNAHFEHNTFQLERLAPMAASPDEHALRIVREWPWATVLDWEPVTRHRTQGLQRRLTLVGSGLRAPARPAPEA